MLCIASARPRHRARALVHARRRRTPTFPIERSRNLETSRLGARVHDGIPRQPRLAPRSRASRLLRTRPRDGVASRRVRRERFRSPSRGVRSRPSRARVSRRALGRGPRRSNPRSGATVRGVEGRGGGAGEEPDAEVHACWRCVWRPDTGDGQVGVSMQLVWNWLRRMCAGCAGAPRIAGERASSNNCHSRAQNFTVQ